MERAAVWQALLESRDAAYQKFNEGLLPGKAGQTLGVRMPRLQQLAGEICRGDWRQFLEETETDTQYELVMLAGLVTGRCRCSWAEKYDRIAAFVPRIDCWGINDSFCAANREAGRRLADLEPLFRQCIASGQTYPIRFVLVMLLDYGLTEVWTPEILELCRRLDHPDYYVQMAAAWLTAEAFARHRALTLPYLAPGVLPETVRRMALQKCRDSRRVSPADKVLLGARSAP